METLGLPDGGCLVYRPVDWRGIGTWVLRRLAAEYPEAKAELARRDAAEGSERR